MSMPSKKTHPGCQGHWGEEVHVDKGLGKKETFLSSEQPGDLLEISLRVSSKPKAVSAPQPRHHSGICFFLTGTQSLGHRGRMNVCGVTSHVKP